VALAQEPRGHAIEYPRDDPSCDFINDWFFNHPLHEGYDLVQGILKIVGSSFMTYTSNLGLEVFVLASHCSEDVSC
jgi:hypothetical protein